MLKSLLFTLMLSAGLIGAIVSSPSAEARSVRRGSSSQYCAWAPNNPSVCAARQDCRVHPLHGRCAKYCNVNPRDVVCGEYYQPSLPRVYPWEGSQGGYQGGFCQQNPHNIACQHNWPWGGY
ncbi:MAG: hypothetical protein EOP11_02885 [Proteobacteria bacterium]|nr:MAG: hypothetical protein EOP11_02885 [Pseudomonadota bacterium]